MIHLNYDELPPSARDFINDLSMDVLIAALADRIDSGADLISFMGRKNQRKYRTKILRQLRKKIRDMESGQ